MKLKHCCIRTSVSCKNCDLYLLFANNKFVREDIEEKGDCLSAAINMAEYLRQELSYAPSGKKDADALRLIQLVSTRLSEYDYMLTLELCQYAMGSIVSRGLRSLHDQSRAFMLMGLYNSVLNRFEECAPDNAAYFEAYAAYQDMRFQVLHLSEDYIGVIKEYDTSKEFFKGEGALQRKLASHFSASAYLSGVSSYRITSRDTADALYEIVRKRFWSERKIAAGDYYILAKYLEHYIQEGEIIKGIDKIYPFIPDIFKNQIETTGEAINRAILHRDLYEAFGKLGEEECQYHYRMAKQIIDDYGLTDQQKKLTQKRNEIERLAKEKVQNSIWFDGGSKTAERPAITINKVGFTIEDVEKILAVMLDSQESRMLLYVEQLAEVLKNSEGELNVLRDQLKSQKTSKGMLITLKNFINETVKTGENLTKVARFTMSVFPKISEKFPELMEFFQKISGT